MGNADGVERSPRRPPDGVEHTLEPEIAAITDDDP